MCVPPTAGLSQSSFAHSAAVVFQEFIAQSVTRTSLLRTFPSVVRNARVTSTGAALNAGSLSGPAPPNIHVPTGKCCLSPTRIPSTQSLTSWYSQMNCHFDGIYLEGSANRPLPMPETQTSRPLTPTNNALPMGVSEYPEPALELLSQDSVTAQSMSASPASTDQTTIATTIDAVATPRTRGPRRSGRQTRRPSYFTPS